MVTYNNSSKHAEYLRKKRNKNILRFTIGFLSIFLFVAFLSYLSHRSFVRVNSISFVGGEVITEDEIKKEALSYLAGSYLGIFPKNNIIWYPQDSLENHLMEKYKRIDTVQVGLKKLNTIEVSIAERKPIGTFCLEGEIETCYFIDKTGFIFDDAPEFSGNVYFRFFNPNLENPLGSFYLEDVNIFLDITNFIEEVKLLGIVPKSLVLKSQGEFSLILNNNTEVLFDTKNPLIDTFENLKALLSSAEISKMNKNNLPIEYIDLRFGNKLFYKLKNQ